MPLVLNISHPPTFVPVIRQQYRRREHLLGMNFSELITGLKEAAANGAAKALAGISAMPVEISKTEAYCRYGRTCVDRWLAEGLLSEPSPKRINREQLEAVASTSNRMTYLPVAER